MSNKAAMTNTTWIGTRHMKERYHTRLLPILFFAAAILSSGLAATADPSHYTYTVSSKRATITGYTGPGGDITIPDTLGGYPVVFIYFYAFAENTSITRVTLPANLVTIYEGAFSFCTSLASITVPASLEFIGESAFSQCTSLAGIAFPTNLTTIGGAAFANCGRITSLELPASLTYIGSSAFTKCTGLTSIVIPASLTTIESYTFEECTSLTSVEIPDSITTIDTSAFEDCTSLSRIIIPDSVTTIGTSAFYHCPSLTRMYFVGAPPSLRWFGFYANTATIYYLPTHAARWSSTYDGRPTLCWNPVVDNMSAPSSTTPFSFAITGTTNIPVAVEARTNLAAGTWDRLLTTNIPPAGILEFSDPAAGHPTRFYRVVAP